MSCDIKICKKQSGFYIIKQQVRVSSRMEPKSRKQKKFEQKFGKIF